MKQITLKRPGGLEHLVLADAADPGAPGPGEIRVRLHANSLNFHDYAVVGGMVPTAEGRIPMADGAGVVEAVGAGVEEFRAGDAV
ncbi:MAG TPA: alcohol dehydrogenase catalytic domain-containing protein, partial [Dyella sp.]|nr:alcohol dehydrogenase catalytic domain-containing protein [Dyella sp.]